MGKIFKIGDLVYTSSGYYLDESRDEGFGVIVDIIDKFTNESFDNKYVITGHGDKNTRVWIRVKMISDVIPKHLYLGDFISRFKINPIENKIIGNHDPHHIIVIDLEWYENKYKECVENLNHNIEFIKRNSITRDNKIDILINDNSN